MKNIHILPTEKPSRLFLNKVNKKLLLEDISNPNLKKLLPSGSYQNIYITSDEEIKYNEYYLGEDNHIYCLVSTVNYNGKKIILTTNPELSPDVGVTFGVGVHKIPDEFLEWFVKNPTCEEVEVIKVCSTGRKCDGKGKNCNMAKLKIIIPKEEQKQDYSGVHLRHCYQGEYEDGCKYGEDDCPAKPLEKPKQLTDLEIAIKLEEIEREEFQQETLEKGLMEIELNHTKILVYSCERALEERNEQIKRMYSEEDVYHILCEHTAFLFAGGKSTLSEWFERFKKK